MRKAVSEDIITSGERAGVMESKGATASKAEAMDSNLKDTGSNPKDMGSSLEDMDNSLVDMDSNLADMETILPAMGQVMAEVEDMEVGLIKAGMHHNSKEEVDTEKEDHIVKRADMAKATDRTLVLHTVVEVDMAGMTAISPEPCITLNSTLARVETATCLARHWAR